MEGLGINLGFLIVQLLNFIILFVVINAWVVKPILRMLDRRKKTIAQGLEDARIASEARASAESESNRIIADAQVKANEIIQEAITKAEAEGKDLRTAAEVEIGKARESAMVEVDGEKNRVLSDIRKQVVSLAIAAATKLVGESLRQDESRQHALLEEFFSGVKAGKVVVLEGNEVSGGSAEVVSALPLTPGEQQAVKKDLVGKLNSEAEITFRVDPSILGGLVIRVGDKVIDGSMVGQLQALKQNLS